VRRRGRPEKASIPGAPKGVKESARDVASGGRVDRRSKRGGSIARERSVANAPVRMIRKSTYELWRGGPLAPVGRRGEAFVLLAEIERDLGRVAELG